MRLNAKEIMPSNGSFAANQFIRYESKSNSFYAWPLRPFDIYTHLYTFIDSHFHFILFVYTIISMRRKGAPPKRKAKKM